MARRVSSFQVPLSSEAAISVRYTREGGRIRAYAVVLLAFAEGDWKAVRLYDNAHDEHHVHRYTQEGAKQPGAKFHDGTASEALQVAIDQLRAGWPEIIESWRR